MPTEENTWGRKRKEGREDPGEGGWRVQRAGNPVGVGYSLAVLSFWGALSFRAEDGLLAGRRGWVVG